MRKPQKIGGNLTQNKPLQRERNHKWCGWSLVEHIDGLVQDCSISIARDTGILNYDMQCSKYHAGTAESSDELKMLSGLDDIDSCGAFIWIKFLNMKQSWNWEIGISLYEHIHCSESGLNTCPDT